MSLMRKALLAGSTNPWLRDHATKYGFVRRSVSRFMPGETVDDALRAARELASDRITTILTRLGENLTTAQEADEVTEHYLQVLDKVAAAGLDAQISIKPTQLGLDLDRGMCERNLDRIIARVEQLGNFMWIDMESSAYVDPTLDLYRHARKRTTRIGLAIQAYLYRAAKDIETLIPLGAAIRIVKGAYLEPADVAFPHKADTDENFFRLCTRLMSEEAQQAGVLLHIATHDAALAERLSAWIAEHGVPSSAYEFAMLYGIQRQQQLRLARGGKRLRVLISYGEFWFPWYMRRLAERPANVWFVMKNLGG
jgi:proline dehydrogenase